MDDLSSMLQQVLDDPESMKQIQAVAESLGLGGDAPQPQEQPSAPSDAGQEKDALSSLLSGLAGGSSAAQNGSPDLGALSGLVSGLAGKSTAKDNGLGALAGLIGGGQKTPSTESPSLPFDVGTLVKLQKAMSTVGSNRSNIELLMALKPRLSPQRAKKVDDAVRVMQLIQFLPLLKESGLFGDDKGGLGSLLNGLGDGVNQMLGGLFGASGGRRA